jgi:hypothetical protein
VTTSATYQPQIAPELIWRILDDGSVLISPSVGEVYVLQRVDSLIWQLLVQRKSVTEIKERLRQRFDLSPEEAHAHLLAFLIMQTGQGVLVWQGVPSAEIGELVATQ